LFDYDLDVDILKSLGFTIPKQSEFVIAPETKPFDIYTDYIGSSILESGNEGNGIIDYYASGSHSGKYSIYWTGSNQYAGPGFNFKPDKDLSALVAGNYELDFWVKGDTPGTKFQVRFVDSKSAVAGDHPWRLSYDVDQTKVAWNGTWQHLNVPLKSFKETGSWDNAWFNPEGKFNWQAVDRLEIISEFNALGSQKIWFDEIRINGTPVTSVNDRLEIAPFAAKAYPNPFNRSTTIEYDLPEAGNVEMAVYDLNGRKQAVLLAERQTQGLHVVQWNLNQKGFLIPKEGVYICKIISSGKTETLKLVFQNR
jgi:endoglucanase